LQKLLKFFVLTLMVFVPALIVVQSAEAKSKRHPHRSTPRSVEQPAPVTLPAITRAIPTTFALKRKSRVYAAAVRP